MAGLTLEFRAGDKDLRLVDPEFPKVLGLTKDRLGILQTAGAVTRQGDEIRIHVVNGRALYRLLREHNGLLEFELVESEMAEE